MRQEIEREAGGGMQLRGQIAIWLHILALKIAPPKVRRAIYEVCGIQVFHDRLNEYERRIVLEEEKDYEIH